MAPIKPRVPAFLLAAALLAAGAGAQDLRFGRLTRDDGLPSSSVSGIVQDSRGFLWFGTKGGLARWDGYSFKVFDNDPYDERSLSHNLVQTLYLDRGDLLWAGTYRGLNRFDTGSKRVVRYVHSESDPESLSNDVVTAVLRDHQGRLWVGTLDGLNALDERSGSFDRYGAKEPGARGLGNPTVRALLETRDGVLWAATYGGLYYLNPGEARFKRWSAGPGRAADWAEKPDAAESGGLPSKIVMCLAEDLDGSLWVGCWGGGVMRLGRDRQPSGSWKFDDNRIYSLCASCPGSLYVGTWGGGLVDLDAVSGAWNVYKSDPRKPFALGNDTVYSLFVDAAGLLWVGTNGGGVYKLDRSRNRFGLYRNYPDDPGSLAKGTVFSVLEDSRGTLWVGFYNGGLDRMDPGSSRFVHYRHDPAVPASLSNDIVNGIMEDPAGDIWVATNEGLDRLDRSRGTFEHRRGGDAPGAFLPDQTVYALAKDSAGRHWYGFFRKGAMRWDPRGGERRYFVNDPKDATSLSDNLVYFIKEDSRGRVWLGTNGGLDLFEDPGFKRWRHDPTNRDSLPSDTVRCMLEDSKGRLWFGTAPGGVSLLDPATGRFTHLTKRDGLKDDNIVALQEDAEGRIWIASNFGLSVYDPERRQLRALEPMDGLQGVEFNSGSFKNKKGELFFGGADGLNRISGATLTRNEHVPPVRLTSLKIFGEEADTGVDAADLRELRLSHEENFLSLEFSALDYADPRSNRYEYQLEGFDQDWVKAGDRRYASYTNLPAGSYVFRVKASNNNGVWNEEGLSLAIRVTPSFWGTPAAFLLYGALVFFLAAAVWLWSSREHRLKLSVAELAERRRIGLELKAAKEAAEAADRTKSEFLANLSHEIRTPMNAVLGYSELLAEKMADDPRRSFVEVIDRSARSLLSLLNDALDLSRMDAGKAPRHPGPVRVRALVADLMEMFRLKADAKGIELRSAVSDSVPKLLLGDEARLRQILVNLIGNAVKFTEKGWVQVRVDAEADGVDGALLISVEDTGIGLGAEDLPRIFEPFYQQEHVDERYGGTGLGLSIVERLVKSLGGSIEVASVQGEGTAFRLRLPGLRGLPDEGSVPAAPDERRLDGAVFLVVEDDRTSGDVLVRLLEARGARATTLPDADAGLRWLAEERCDAVLADLRMPGMGGFAFLQALRSQASTAELPVVVVTADAQARTRSRIADFHKAYFLAKPLDRTALMDALEQALPRLVLRPSAADLPQSRPAESRPPDDLAAALAAELDAPALAALAEALAGDSAAARGSLAGSFELDRWAAFHSALGRAAAAGGSRALASYVGRLGRALDGLDLDALSELGAEFDAFMEGKASD